MKEIKVNDMSCVNCVRKIQTSLLTKNIKLEIDLKNHTVKVNESNLDLAVETIKDLGYTPEV